MSTVDASPQNQVRTQILHLLREARAELHGIRDEIGDPNAQAVAFGELDEIIAFVESRVVQTPSPMQTTHYSKSTVSCGRITNVYRDRWQLDVKLVDGSSVTTQLSKVSGSALGNLAPGEAGVDRITVGLAVDVVRDSAGGVIAVRMPPWDDKHGRPRGDDEVPA